MSLRRTRTRRNLWGSVIERYDRNGNLNAYQARYTNPLDHHKKVQRNFKPDQKSVAYNWLEEEHTLVELHEKGRQTWVHPTERKKQEQAASILFRDYVDQWVKNYRTKNGKKLAGGSLRNLKADISHFMPFAVGRRCGHGRGIP
jgi:hypothetical protein